jgi:hypothetical protein
MKRKSIETSGGLEVERNATMASNLDGRSRDEDGEIRRKRSDTKVGTLRDIYGPGFAPGARSDMELGTLLDRTGAESLDDYLKNHKK